MDATTYLKNKIRDYIAKADERVLKLINEIIETEEHGWAQGHKDLLEQRIKYHKENPEDGKSWEEVKENLLKQYGLINYF